MINYHVILMVPRQATLYIQEQKEISLIAIRLIDAKSVAKLKNLRSYGSNGKEVTDIDVPRKTPIVAMRDMEFLNYPSWKHDTRT